MTILSQRKRVWAELDPMLATQLSDARRQVHHAAQFVAAIGISYLPKADDDSHTNMEWFAGMLASKLVGPRPFRLGVRPHPLSVAVIVGDAELRSLALDGKTLDQAAAWIRTELEALYLDPSRFTLAKHYTIPDHPVAHGAAFDTTNIGPFEQLGRWYHDADIVLRGVAEGRADASTVRCWPHHFDMATLLTIEPGKTIGVGLEPGDGYYDEPYWYVNRYPAPSTPPTAPLDGGGSWHTREWTGAVLPGSHLAPGDQRAQIECFINSAIGA